MFYDFITKYTEIFVKKLREAFKTFSHFFNKNIGVFEILTIEILTTRELTTLLVSNSRALVDSLYSPVLVGFFVVYLVLYLPILRLLLQL